MNAPASSSRELLSTRAGFTVLALVAIFIVIWLALQSRLSSDATSAALPAQTSTDQASGDNLSRFRSDAFYLPNEPLLGFVAVEAGPFLMGSDPEVDSQAFESERWSLTSNQGKLELPTFYIGRFEVTVAQYRAFVSASGYKGDPLSVRAPPTFPVTHVAWTDALAYADWLEHELKKSTAAPAELRKLFDEGWQLSLPTDAQWEKAARGPNGRIYPWGTGTEIAANYRSTSPAPVGSHPCPQCMFGLADMSGNVWELTRSPYQPYPYTEADDMTITGAALYVMRGGGFADQDNMLRAAVRGGVDPGARRPFIGFRLVLTK